MRDSYFYCNEINNMTGHIARMEFGLIDSPVRNIEYSNNKYTIGEGYKLMIFPKNSYAMSNVVFCGETVNGSTMSREWIDNSAGLNGWEIASTGCTKSCTIQIPKFLRILK